MLLLLLLLLPTPICAERKLFRSELTFDIAPTCAKPGTNIHFVKTVQCPCFIAFGLSSTMESSTRVDFLVLSHGNFRTWENEKFVPEPEILLEYSFLSRSAVSISLLDKQYSYETSNLELPRNDSFTFVIRTHSEKEDCDMQILHIFEPQPTPCPTHLPEHALGNGRQNVVAGVPGDNELQNHMVLISSFSGACSGSVIGANYILTAAHCAPHGGKAFIGGRTAKSGREYDIVKFIPHPSYDGSNDGRLEAHDIGIARVSGNLSRHIVKYSKVMAPSGDFVRAAGYGQIAEGWVTGDERRLRTVDMAVMRFGDCVKRFVEFGARGFARALEQGSHVCVGGECGDTCYGDSGGPIVVNEDGVGYVQVGIVSGGIGCARPRLPGIYTKLGEYGDWVEEVTGVRGVVLEFGNVGVEEELVAVGDDGARLKIVGLGVLASSVGLGVLLLVGILVWTQIRRNRNGDTDEIMANDDRERVMSFSKRDLC